MAAVATGLLGIFQWNGNYVRFAYVGEALQSERIKFETQTTADYEVKLDKHEALASFVTRVEALVMSEVGDWRGQMRKSAVGSSDEQH